MKAASEGLIELCLTPTQGNGGAARAVQFAEFCSGVADSARQYVFVCMIARRMFNLVPVTQYGVGVMTDHAILLQYKKIADYYRKNGAFPKVLIMDDVLIHGRGISSLLATLWALVLYELSQGRVMSGDETYDTYRDFLQAVDIRVYACNKRKILLKGSFCRKLDYSKHLYALELRELAGICGDHIYAARDRANTCFVFSARLPELAQVDSSGWDSVKWQFTEKFNTPQEEDQTKRMTVFVRRPETEEVRYLQTVRYKDLPGQPDGEKLVTSLVLFNQIPLDVFEEACTQCAGLLAELCPALAELLQLEHPLLRKCRMQLLSFFASVITFFDFAGELCGSAEEVVQNSDLDKISSNFGPCEEIYPELRTVCSDAALREELRKVVFGCFEKGSVLCQAPQSYEQPPEEEMDRITEQGKRFFGRLGGKAEADAYGARPHIDGWIKGQSDFSEYLAVMQNECGCSLVSQIAAFLFLMEDGVHGMNVYCGEDSRAVSCVAKAGEKATFVLAEPLAVELPGLALVEQECWRLNLEPEEAITRFLSWVEESENFLDSGRKEEILQACRWIYSCGHTLAGWDFEMITLQKDLGRKEQQENYLRLAKVFLHLI